MLCMSGSRLCGCSLLTRRGTKMARKEVGVRSFTGCLERAARGAGCFWVLNFVVAAWLTRITLGQLLWSASNFREPRFSELGRSYPSLPAFIRKPRLYKIKTLVLGNYLFLPPNLKPMPQSLRLEPIYSVRVWIVQKCKSMF